jgi:pimeloyl-ACP methyl ester carboxylesterase
MSALGGEAVVARSRDGVRVVFDVSGTGPMVMLLHGGGQSRLVWHELGYVARLQDQFTVVTVDIRGHGKSDRPVDLEAYAIERFRDDVLAVADTVGQTCFSVCGYSYGGNIARYLPMYSDRVAKIVMIGVAFGAAAPAEFRAYADRLRTKWAPTIDAWRAGRLSLASLSDDDRTWWQTGNIPSMVAQMSAILDWPSMQPADLPCPALWVMGTANESAMRSLSEYEPSLSATDVTVHLLPGLAHDQELSRIEDTLPLLRRFMQPTWEPPRRSIDESQGRDGAL